MHESRIKEIALEYGFALAGIADCSPLDLSAHLNGAVQSGRIADMRFLARDISSRLDPSSLLTGARSVITLAMAYGEYGLGNNGSGQLNSLIARYARGDDYHDLISAALDRVWREIKKIFPEGRAKLCCDTSPIMEKGLAARAGIGWIGKNSLLINERYGSFLLLGEIVTDIEFIPDRSIESKCGDCSLCIDGCPSRAITAPYELDARRCISYWTTMAKSRDSCEISSIIDEGAYGCDACQELCPFNKRF